MKDGTAVPVKGGAGIIVEVTGIAGSHGITSEIIITGTTATGIGIGARRFISGSLIHIHIIDTATVRIHFIPMRITASVH